MIESYRYTWKSSITRTGIICVNFVLVIFILLVLMVGFRPLDLVVFLPFPMIIWLIFGDQSFLACSVIVTSKELRIEAKPQGVQIINLEKIISVKIVSTPLAVKRSGMTISFESTIAYKLNGWNMLQIHTKRQSNPNIFLIGVSDAPKLQKAIENALEARKNSI